MGKSGFETAPNFLKWVLPPDLFFFPPKYCPKGEGGGGQEKLCQDTASTKWTLGPVEAEEIISLGRLYYYYQHWHPVATWNSKGQG